MRAGARRPTDPTARQVFVVDTSVIVSGLIGADPNSPPHVSWTPCWMAIFCI